MKIIAITQARTGSTRLPGKVLMEVNQKSLLQLHLERLKRSKEVKHIIVATTINPEDKAIIEIAEQQGLEYYAGSEDNVLDRYYKAALPHNPDYVVRVTSDCPLIDPKLIDAVVNFAVENKVHYASNVLIEKYFPDGQDIEVFKYSELVHAWENATLKSDKEHVTPYIRKRLTKTFPEQIKNFNGQKELGFLRMTVDEPEDFEVIKTLIESVGEDKAWEEYAYFLMNNEKIKSINSHIKRNDGYIKSISKDNENC